MSSFSLKMTRKREKRGKKGAEEEKRTVNTRRFYIPEILNDKI